MAGEKGHNYLHPRPTVTLALGHVWVTLLDSLAENKGSDIGDLRDVDGCEIPQDFNLVGWDFGPLCPFQLTTFLHAHLYHISDIGVQVDGPVVVTLRASTASVLNAHLG